MHKQALALTLCGALALPAVAPIVAAQEVTGVAQTLFDEGKKLMDAEKYEQGCPKLAESYKLQAFTGTLLNLATCYERWGKTATAWAQFRDALAASRREGNDKRAEYARAHIAALEPKISHLTVSVKAGVDASAFSISIDGVSLGTAILGADLPIDPGKHVISVTQQGKKPWETDVEIGKENDRKAVEIPPLVDLPAPPKEQPKPLPRGPEAPAPNRTAGWVVGTIGVALIGSSLFTGIEASSKWNTRNDLCPNDLCRPGGLDADKSARRWALATDVLLATGVIATGVGAYLLLKPGSSSSSATSGSAAPPTGSTYVAPAMGPGYAGLAVSGAF